MRSIKKLTKRIAPLLVMLAVLMAVAAIAVPTLAYYMRKSNDLVEDYGPAESGKPIVVMPGGQVSNVTVKVEDEGYPVYVRAVVVINWQNEQGDQVAFSPASYNLTIGKDWKTVVDKGGNTFYYYTKPVASGGVTTALIDSCNTNPSDDSITIGYSLRIEVIVQTVQAIGTDGNSKFGWQDAWGVNDLWPQTPSTPSTPSTSTTD